MRRVRKLATVVLLGTALLATASPAPAQMSEDASVENRRMIEKAFDLTLCALSLAAAPSGLGIWIAALSCGKAAHTWWSD